MLIISIELYSLIVRCCFVTTFERAEQYRNDDPNIKPCPDIEYPIGGLQVVRISGKLRETAYEVLFPHDNERTGLPYIVLDSILMSPLDMRKQLANNLFLIGGTSMAMGLTSRLKSELFALLKTPLYKVKLFLDSIQFHSAPAKQNFTSWLGGKYYKTLKQI